MKIKNKAMQKMLSIMKEYIITIKLKSKKGKNFRDNIIMKTCLKK